jgi:hypothetical protein
MLFLVEMLLFSGDVMVRVSVVSLLMVGFWCICQEPCGFFSAWPRRRARK